MIATERVIEIPFMLQHLPKSGIVLDVGSNEATYLGQMIRDGIILHCLDPRPRDGGIPASAYFHQASIIDSKLPSNSFDCITAISTVEHIGLPYYDQPYIEHGDALAMQAIYSLLRPSGYVILTVPVGQPKNFGWFRQYSIAQLKALLKPFQIERLDTYGLRSSENRYVEIGLKAVPIFDYESSNGINRAGAVACVIARKLG